jgi:hypothetical protein
VKRIENNNNKIFCTPHSKKKALEASIDKALSESRRANTRPHYEVMAEIRARYKNEY